MWQLVRIMGKQLGFCLLGVVGVCAIVAASQSETTTVDLLLLNGRVIDGTGSPWIQRDIGITGDKIVFVGNARHERVSARETVDVSGLLVTPGFWDMHSHADVVSEWGRQSRNQLYQGITTVVIGVDGGGESNVAEQFESDRKDGIAVNTVRYVGFRRARMAAMGGADRPPTPAEMEVMKAYVTKAMTEGAVGLSTGLAVPPGIYATTEEVIEVSKVAARLGGVYDTHDRDMGVTFKSIGYLNSVREVIEIAERAGLPAIFSHFNAQGPANFGLVPEATDLINRARARGVNIMAAQHLYTATNSGLQYYTLPPWADEGGPEGTDAPLEGPENPAASES